MEMRLIVFALVPVVELLQHSVQLADYGAAASQVGGQGQLGFSGGTSVGSNVSEFAGETPRYRTPRMGGDEDVESEDEFLYTDRRKGSTRRGGFRYRLSELNTSYSPSRKKRKRVFGLIADAVPAVFLLVALWYLTRGDGVELLIERQCRRLWRRYRHVQPGNEVREAPPAYSDWGRGDSPYFLPAEVLPVSMGGPVPLKSGDSERVPAPRGAVRGLASRLRSFLPGGEVKDWHADVSVIQLYGRQKGASAALMGPGKKGKQVAYALISCWPTSGSPSGVAICTGRDALPQPRHLSLISRAIPRELFGWDMLARRALNVPPRCDWLILEMDGGQCFCIPEQLLLFSLSSQQPYIGTVSLFHCRGRPRRQRSSKERDPFLSPMT